MSDFGTSTVLTPVTPVDLGVPALERRDADPLQPPPASVVLLSLAIAATIVLLPFDAVFSHWVAESLAPDGTRLRAVLRLVQRLVGAEAIVVYALVLAYASASAGRGLRPVIGATIVGLFGAAMMHASKFAVGRARPQLDFGAQRFEPATLADSFDSFPSAHAGTAMLTVLLIVNFVPLRGKARWLLIPLAIFVVAASLTRVAQRRHFPSDVAAGVAFACLAFVLAKRFLKNEYLAPLTRPRDAAAA
ncbi:MAG: phosphatase PAP2 family protein [Phycisphaerae bacterium]|nr:phosphatase PAP2 family protein [Phycisphaerae bacterium]